MSLPQLILSIPLFLILMFGIGFILNMILKTTWLPLGLYLILVVILWFYYGTFKGGDLLVLVGGGLSGAFLSGWTIKILRSKGYRMF